MLSVEGSELILVRVFQLLPRLQSASPRPRLCGATQVRHNAVAARRERYAATQPQLARNRVQGA